MNPTEKLRKLQNELIRTFLRGDSLLPLLEAALTKTRNEARREALEEAAEVTLYWCDLAYHGEHCENDCSFARIRSLIVADKGWQHALQAKWPLPGEDKK